MLNFLKQKSWVLIAAAVVFAVGILFLVWLGLAFAGQVYVPQQFRVGLLTINLYGICLAVGVTAGMWLAIFRIASAGISRIEAESLFLWLLVCGFFGARIYHVASQWAIYSQNLTEIAKIWHGGLGIYGAVLGGVIGLIAWKNYYRIETSYLKLLDWLTPSLIVGQIIGRFGNFFNYELYGWPTNLPWAMFVPETFRPTAYVAAQFFTPLFLYEALLNLGLLAILLVGLKRTINPGLRFGYYLLGYGLFRFFLEFLKIDPILVYGWKLNSILGLILGSVGIIIIFYAYRSDRQIP